MKKMSYVPLVVGASVILFASQSALAACSDLPRSDLKSAVDAAAAAETGGYGLKMWATMVDETGKVCHVVTNGDTGQFAGNAEWLGSRIISAQKANTANAFSLDGYAISSSNLYEAVSEGSLYGLQASNPVDASRSYLGSPSAYGTNSDPIKGKRIGGVNVFGGGLALYKAGKKIGAVGVSGDTSCRDHAFAWRIRGSLEMHPGGVGITTVNMNAAGNVQEPLPGAKYGDEMILSPPPHDTGNYWETWAQPVCPNSLKYATPENGILLITSK